MIDSVVALALAVLAIVLLLAGQLLHRRQRARAAEMRRMAAAHARLRGHADRAELHEQRAAVLARHVWPFKVRPSITFEVPTGIVTADHKLTDEEVREFVKRWREHTDGLHAMRVYPAIGTETTTETGMAWHHLRRRITRLITREGRDQ